MRQTLKITFKILHNLKNNKILQYNNDEHNITEGPSDVQGRSVVFQFRYAHEGVVKQWPIEGASLLGGLGAYSLRFIFIFYF